MTNRQIRLRGFDAEDVRNIVDVLDEAGIRTENIDIVQEVDAP